jgi:hypothetical protein
LAKTNLSQQKDAVKFAVILEGKNAAKIQWICRAQVVYACNPSYSGGRD